MTSFLLDGHVCTVLLKSCVASFLLKWKHKKKKFMLRLVKCLALNSKNCHEICGHLKTYVWVTPA